MKRYNHRKVFVVPASLFCMLSLVGCNNNNGTKGGLNTILVTYDAGDGYFNDGFTKSTTKVCEVRKGVRYSNLSDSEKPKESEIISNKKDDNFKFSQSWKANKQVGSSTQEVFINSTNDFVFNDNITLTACYESTERNFVTDSWDTLIAKAELGFTTLKEYYATSYTQNNNTFVGLEKNLTYAGETYPVRVIGEKIDEVADSNNKVACLTFEFVNVLPGYSFNVFEESNRYNNSSVQKALNNEVKNNIESFNTSHLQIVNKKTYKKTASDTSASIETTKEQVFIPSLSELNITTDPNGKKLTVNDDNEGDTYQYFTPADGLETTQNTRRKKMYIPTGSTEGIEYMYWTRSIDISDIQSTSSWPIYSDGKCGCKGSDGTYESLGVKKALGFAPCFCIGITDSEKVTFETDSWDNIIATANQGYGALVTRYNNDYKNAKDKVELKDGTTTVATVYRKPANSFVGLTHKLNILNDSNNYEEYTVRVIGENHDYTYDPLNTSTAASNKKRAALTFQLTRDYNKKTVWDDAAHAYWDGEKLTKNWHSSGGPVNFFYGASTLRHNLSGYGCDSSSGNVWSKPLINRIKFSDEATSPDGSTHIKEVRKQTHQLSDFVTSKGNLTGQGIKEQQYNWHKDCENGAKYITDKLFPLNTFENGTEKYLVYREKIDNNKTITLKDNFAIQGYAYEYYDYEKIYIPTTHVENILLPELNTRRASDDTTGYATSAGSYLRQAIPCRLGTISSADEYQKVIKSVVTWSTDGSYKGWEYYTQNERYARPAFCIGETLESTLKAGGYIS